MFRCLLTYTNNLRVLQIKNHKELSHMTLVAIYDHHYAKRGNQGITHGATELYRWKHDRWHHPAETTTLECAFQ